jgi:septal ring factor EnvC (AmiA/AmiB activator)
VSGLYKRAVEYLKSQGHLRLVGKDEPDEFVGSAEEQAHIEQEIQRAIDENRIPVGPETFRVTPQKRGAGLPLFVNLVAVILIVAGVFLLLRLFTDQEADIAAETATVRSAEGRLLSALREESSAQLSEKEAEIAEIERQLALVEQEREQIRSSAQTRLDEQETTLRAEFEAQLEVERARLAGIDISDTERASRLADFRGELERDLQAELAQIREASAEDLAAQEAAIEAALSEYQETLLAAERERESLRENLAEREAELQAQFAVREAELSGERQAAEELLAELEQQQRRTSLIQDQILSFYIDVRAGLSAGALDEAELSLSELRTYLETGTIASVPELQRRRQVDLFLVSTLEDRIRRTRSAQNVDTQALVQSANLIAEVNELAAEAETAFLRGSREQARELYLAAISRIPAVELGYERLEELEAELALADEARVVGLIRDANELYRTGSYEAAAQAYGQALSRLPAPDDQTLGRILDAGYQLRAEDSGAELGQVREQLETSNERLSELEAALTQTERALNSTETVIARLEGELAVSVNERNSLSTELATLRARLGEQRELVRQIDIYRQSFQSEGDAAGETVSELELLEAKLLILRIVGSEAVRADYPELYDELNDFLDALVREQRAAATRETLEDLDRLLASLASESRGIVSRIESLPEQYPALSGISSTATSNFFFQLQRLVDPDQN